MTTEKTGQGGTPIDLHKADLNPNEVRVIRALADGIVGGFALDGLGVRNIAELATVFPEHDREKARSCVRNALRRPVRGGWVTHGETIGDGKYRLTSLGVERWGTIAAPPGFTPRDTTPPTRQPSPTKKKVEQRAAPVKKPVPKAPRVVRDGRNIQQRADAFRSKHPNIYKALVALARQAKAAGVKRVGMGTLYEVVRWQRLLVGDPVKLNNSWRSRIARHIVKTEPSLAPLFFQRELKSS
jgi:hypothetical protein